ncbi:MAG TPA: lysophospholipid acyltransferase family protein [Myxococcales bacterium]|jgi:1-acyl-sn-glycerol-3-phosphate acyltransferase
MPDRGGLVRRALRAFFGLVLRIFFRHLEIHGAEKLPATGPAVVVLNHPSGLIDPLFVLALLPRPASFLAKAPLFRMPIISFFVRALDSIPVFRKQDKADTAQNKATFEAARAVLGRGGVLALFPEGTSHDEPHLLPLKTGAARIALGAASGPLDKLGVKEPLRIVPAGLTFADKTRFRSDALMRFGEPFAVEPVALEQDGEPPAEAVRALTRKIEDGLGEVVLQAEREEALELVARAERIFLAPQPGTPALSTQFDVRRGLLDGWAKLRRLDPERAEAVVRRIRHYESALEQSGLDPGLLDPKYFRAASVVSFSARALAWLFLLLPLAVVGTVVHAPAWLAVDFLSRRMARKDLAVLATMKVLAGMLFYPLTWLALGIAAGRLVSVPVGLAAPVVAIAAGWAALRFFERLDVIVGGARALGLFLFRRRAFLRMAKERDGIRQQLVELAAELERPTPQAKPD